MLAYDLIAAVVGAGARGRDRLRHGARARRARSSTGGLDLTFSVAWQSVLVAYCLGVLLTLVVVTLSAWRVSVLNVSTAIRNLPDPAQRRRRGRWILGLVGLMLGALMTSSGISAKQATPLLVGCVARDRRARCPSRSRSVVNERAAYTIGGAALVVWLLLPFSVYKALVPNLSMDFSTWVVERTARRRRRLVADRLQRRPHPRCGHARVRTHQVVGSPVLRTSITTPLRNRFRTGMTLAMFTLVVFTLVVGTITTSSFTGASNNLGEVQRRLPDPRRNPTDEPHLRSRAPR